MMLFVSLIIVVCVCVCLYWRDDKESSQYLLFLDAVNNNNKNKVFCGIHPARWAPGVILVPSKVTQERRLTATSLQFINS